MTSFKFPRRLTAAADMVLPDAPAADIGSDHMHLPVYLIKQGICPYVIATDKAASPCINGAAYISSLGLADKIDIRCGDGLAVLKPGEAATIIITGMGGCLIKSILAAAPKVAASGKRLVLSPQKNPDVLRYFLAETGWRIVEEKMVKEDDIWYPLIAAQRGRMKLNAAEAEFGPYLLAQGTPEFRHYLQHKTDVLSALIRQLTALESTGCSHRIRDLQAERLRILNIMEGIASDHTRS